MSVACLQSHGGNPMGGDAIRTFVLKFQERGYCGIQFEWGVPIHWTGLLDWTTGLDYWTQNLTTKSHFTAVTTTKISHLKQCPCLAAGAIFHWGIWTLILSIVPSGAIER